MAQGKSEQRTLTVGGFTFCYTWERKAVKNYNLRVRADASIYLSTPTRVTTVQAERFLTDKIEFIRAALQRAAQHAAKPQCLAEGETLPIFGISHTICHLKASKVQVFCEDGKLFLSLPDPTDTPARLRAFWRFARERLQAFLQELLPQYAPYFLSEKEEMPQISLRRMKSRWGTCFYRENRIHCNSLLVFLPRDCIRYVLCHELAHFCHHDHSAQFYSCLSRAVPEYKALRRMLREFPLPALDAGE